MGQGSSKVLGGSASQSLYPSRLPATSIRLLTLLPGKRDKPVVTRLTTYGIHDSDSYPLYDAVSYVWGDPKDTVEITCNDVTIGITRNLHWALNRVRRKRPKLVLWVDAICINQDDRIERGAQVALMGSIYSAAQKVYVCLGDENFSEDATMHENMDALVMVLAHLEARPPSSWAPAIKDQRYIDVWMHIFLIHQQPWFRRAWVLQEVGFARDPRVLYGEWEFGYRVLIQVTTWLSLPGEGFRLAAGLKIHAKWLNWYQKDEFASSPFDLLYDASYLKCQDPRDIIFAFLGHPSVSVAVSSEGLIRPDYTKDTSLVFEELSTLLARKGDIRFLGCIEHTKKSLGESLPGWVIRWDWWIKNGKSSRISLVASRVGKRKTWDSCRGLEGPDAQLEGKLLQVHGVLVDTIAEIFRIHWLPENELAFENKTNGMRLAPTALLDLFKHLPFAYGQKIARDDPTETSTRFSSRCEYLLATLSGGFLHDNSVRDYSSRNVLDSLEKEFQDAGAHREGAAPDTVDVDRFGSKMRFENVGAELRHELRKGCAGRHFAITDAGHYIQIPAVAQVGDLCCVLRKFPAPVIVRLDHHSDSSERGETWQFLGEAWSCGLMDGEAALMVEKRLATQQVFTFR